MSDDEMVIVEMTDAINAMSLTTMQRLSETSKEYTNFRTAHPDWELVELKLQDPVAPSGQMEQVREDQVANHCGGYVFSVSDETRVRRFIILGTDGPKYYASAKEQKADNLKAMVDIIDRGNAHIILKEIYEISLAGRNPKQNSLLMALALCARYRVHDKRRAQKDGDDEGQKLFARYINEMHYAALKMVNEVCRIPTHLFMFVDYCQLVSKMMNAQEAKTSTGWGRMMRNTVEKWYQSKEPYLLALHMTKYPQREGWSHRDLFRLAHPVLRAEMKAGPSALEYEQIFRFAVKGEVQIRKRKLDAHELEINQPDSKYSAIQMDTEEQSRALDLIETVLKIKNEKDELKIVEAIQKYNLVREHIPTEHLNSVPVWQALLKKMPLTALIRNLGKLSAIKALDDSEYKNLVISKITDAAQLHKSKVHPITILMAKTVYDAGSGFRGKLTWEIKPEISKALETAFLASFKNVEPTNKRYLLAYDVSGSMTFSNIENSMLTPRTASAALGMIHLNTEPNIEVMGFSDHFMELPYTKEWSMEKICDHMNNLEFGQTDCALPMLWAMEKKKKFDCFIVYTDNETYFGDTHPFEAMRQYRETSGIHDAKLVVMGMTATEFTIADPTDVNMLDIAGFDSAVPQLLSEFVMGKL